MTHTIQEKQDSSCYLVSPSPWGPVRMICNVRNNISTQHQGVGFLGLAWNRAVLKLDQLLPCPYSKDGRRQHISFLTKYLYLLVVN
jgi:hypothetical protein